MREWLKTLRKDNNLTAAEMADKLGISESYYSLIENGERQKKMDIVLVTRIAEALYSFGVRSGFHFLMTFSLTTGCFRFRDDWYRLPSSPSLMFTFVSLMR